ncbi:MAG: hypothetical protein ACOCTP_04730, partial [Roseicyclus sp.]
MTGPGRARRPGPVHRPRLAFPRAAARQADREGARMQELLSSYAPILIFLGVPPAVAVSTQA